MMADVRLLPYLEKNRLRWIGSAISVLIPPWLGHLPPRPSGDSGSTLAQTMILLAFLTALIVLKTISSLF